MRLSVKPGPREWAIPGYYWRLRLFSVRSVAGWCPTGWAVFRQMCRFAWEELRRSLKGRKDGR